VCIKINGSHVLSGSNPDDTSMGGLGKGSKALDRAAYFLCRSMVHTVCIYGALFEVVEMYVFSFYLYLRMLNDPLGSYANTKFGVARLLDCRTQLYSVRGMGSGDRI
jgi:hypothetical protein